ncbi:outer membrane protein [Oceanicola sp. S124]|uniref:outer membrane protein n=1 Tax=Oceanicola sp. S124 TaxID=1042378 RepID=UPI0002558287|nr:outer membrane beta-barrel protein [Oceanicola sp. S124]
MKHIIKGALTLAIAAQGVLGMTAVASAQAAPAAESWAGAYAGLKAEAFRSGETSYNFVNQGGTTSFPYDLAETTEGGLFMGHNFTYGNIVFGPEIAYTRGGPAEQLTPGSELEGVADLKARVGYATGQVLVYGFLGYSYANWSEFGSRIEIDGKIYGLGVDYLMPSGLFLGAELSRRELEGHYYFGSDYLAAETTSLSLRAGYRF